LWAGRCLVQASMRSPSIVIVDVVTDRPLQVLVAEYQPVIKTFVTDAAL